MKGEDCYHVEQSFVGWLEISWVEVSNINARKGCDAR